MNPVSPARPANQISLPGSELCVHCGFCLQACPTYLAFDDENDSPRGRIVLMKAIADGQLAGTDADAQLHLDRCLGCRACESACPSGVPYGQLLETTRERLAAVRSLPVVARLILSVIAHRVLLSLAMFGVRLLRTSGIPNLLARVPGPAGFALAMISSTRRSGAERRRRYAAHGDGARGTAATLRGCVMEGLFAPANRATERTLRVNGYHLVDAPGQRCCGALHAHAGDAGTARALARANISAFATSGADVIAVNSAGCGAMMKSYAHLLQDDSVWQARAAGCAERVRDVSELLAAAGPQRGAPRAGRVAYDAPCHLMHGQRVTAAPFAVLGAVPELELVALEGAEQCCGSAGIFNLVQPDVSNRVLEAKLTNIAAAGVAVVATGNPGCLMQIGAGLLRGSATGRAPVARHPVELLDASYAAQAALG